MQTTAVHSPCEITAGFNGHEHETEVLPFSSPPPVMDNPYEVSTTALFEVFERKDMSKLELLGGVQGLLKKLQSHGEHGIQPSTVGQRQAVFGKNELKKKEPVTFLEFLREAFQDRIILMLCFCAVLSIIFAMTLPNPHTHEIDRATGWIEGVAIIISVLVVTLMGSINNYQKAKRFEEMEAEQSVVDVQVFRGGSEITIKSDEIVVGDIYSLEGGVQLSCDCLLVYGTGYKCSEGAMTGESDILKKSPEKDPFFLSGTLVEEGAGRVLVVAVGISSYQGQMKEQTQEDSPDTPLQLHLGDLAELIGRIAFVAASLLVAGLWIKEGILISRGDRVATAAAFLNYVIIAITVVVVAIPEGLPLAVTISLAFSMKSMMEDQCMVRVLASCETMGTATAVCSDKTGTLTTNVMSSVQGCVADEEFVVAGYGVNVRHDSVLQIDRHSAKFGIKDATIELLCDALSFNSTAREQLIDNKLQWVGNKTEHGLLGYVQLAGRDYRTIRASVPEYDVIQFPFNSAKKIMTTVVRSRTKSLLYCKGASEIVLGLCDRYVARDSSLVKLTPEQRQRFQDVIMDMASQGNRTIGVAYDNFASSALPTEEPDDREMIFIGVLGVQDPIREAVPDAVLNCQGAGITVRMVTGDHIHTAIAIAKKCHIFEDNGWDLAMTGEEFRKLLASNKGELLELLPRLRVLARSSPKDKHELVHSLQELGDIVGVTGDGSNDAPALKLANVGFAMQIGTDISKGAADMILLDNNFASVVNAVKWGRAVNDNIRKFLQFQLSINFAGVILTFVGALASPTSKEPFAAVQLLWLNLIMDTLAALALATEKPEDHCLLRLPVFKQAPLISWKMRSFVASHGAFQFALIVIILFTGHKWLKTVEAPDMCDRDFNDFAATVGTNFSITVQTACSKLCAHHGGSYDGRYCQQGEVHSTIVFNTFIWFQIFNVFNARKLYSELNPFEGIWTRSRLLLIIAFVIVAFQIFAVEVAGKFLETAPLKLYHWLICVGFGALELPLGLLVRLLPIIDTPPNEITERWAKERRLRESLGLRSATPPVEGGKRFLFVKKDPSIRASIRRMTKRDLETIQS